MHMLKYVPSCFHRKKKTTKNKKAQGYGKKNESPQRNKNKWTESV